VSDQWTDNPDAASDDAPEVLPDTVTEGSREADSVAEGLDAAVGVDSADDVDTSADDDVDTSADDDAAETPVASATDEDGDRLDVVDPVQAFKDDLRSKVGDWYVVHSYAGYENRVKANLETRITSSTWRTTSSRSRSPWRRSPRSRVASASSSAGSGCPDTSWSGWTSPTSPGVPCGIPPGSPGSSATRTSRCR
jgi:hypothetical protein